jgi:hypothetical protein
VIENTSEKKTLVIENTKTEPKKKKKNKKKNSIVARN